MSSNRTEFYKGNISLTPVAEKTDFAREEERISKFWEDNEIFKSQLKKTENCPEYSFYDGPPFATGLPHYGHICAGTIKVCLIIVTYILLIFIVNISINTFSIK